MKRLLEAVKACLEINALEAALFVCLSLPDICGKIDQPEMRTEERYIKWVEKYLVKYYLGVDTLNLVFGELNFLVSNKDDIDTSPILIADDFYQIRCYVLHAGNSNDIQNGRKLLDTIIFVSETRHVRTHKLRRGDKVYLDIDTFCKDILKGVEEWLNDIKNDSVKMNLADKILKLPTSTSM